MECSKCGVSGDRVQLFDVISKEGIVKLCRNCSIDEDLPIIRKPVEKKEEKRMNVHDRLSVMSGVKPARKISDAVRKQNVSLKEIANSSSVGVDEGADKNLLVDNFHWVLLRVRRMRKITHEQLAKEIGEPVAAVKMLERGIFPKNYREIIRKIEIRLRVHLFRGEEGAKVQLNIGFDPTTMKNLTIADLHKMKDEKSSVKADDTGLFEKDFAFDEEKKEPEEKKPKKRRFFGFLRGKPEKGDEDEGE